MFTSTFTDEPSLMSSWLRPMPYYVLPWCPDLPADYRARTGRDLLADVPAIVFENASGTTPRLRYGFWNLVGDRVSRNYRASSPNGPRGTASSRADTSSPRRGFPPTCRTTATSSAASAR